MGRYLGSKAKICKRVGANIYGTPKYDAILAKASSKKKTMKKSSEYGTQLLEKQKARFMFGISEKQFERYFEKALHSQGVTGAELLRSLERRLDNVIYRAGLAQTRPQARQMASHGHFELNGHKVTVPSIAVRPGDVITLRKKMETSPLYVGFGEVESLKWLKIDAKKKTVTVERLPEEDELERTIAVQLIVEYYSR